MIIIIDAYNLLKYNKKNSYISEREQKLFIDQLARYSNAKKHDLIVVFDGGKVYNVESSQDRYLKVIYAGIGKTADNYIISFVDNMAKNLKKLVLVSSDRQLCSELYKYDIVSIDVDIFRKIIVRNEKKTAQKNTNIKNNMQSKIIKYEKESETTNPTLDNLMEEGSKVIIPKDKSIGQISNCFFPTIEINNLAKCKLPKKLFQDSQLSRNDKKLLDIIDKL